MMPTCAVRISTRDAAQFETLRTVSELEVCEQGDHLWLKTANPADMLQRSLRSLPAAELFDVLPDGQLCRAGSRVPNGYVPEGPWQRLSTWLAVELPVAALPGQISDRVPLRLAPDLTMREPNMLLTSLSEWAEYADLAPQVRLDRWHFAVSARGEVLVRGLPLPPLPGTRLVEEDDIVVPCGQHWSPAVDARVLGRLFRLASKDLLLWMADDRQERINADQFVRATRSAIRTTARTMNVEQ